MGPGARLGDVANLRWSNLETVHGVVTFKKRKGQKAAVLGFHPDFSDWVAEKRSVPDDPESFLFPSLAGRPHFHTVGRSVSRLNSLDSLKRRDQGPALA
jgi:integrase